MTKKIFITGTGISVGKTYISSLIIKKMRENGFDCGYYKPILNDVTEIYGKLIDSDVNYVLKNSDISDEPEICTSYWTSENISINLSSKLKKHQIDIDKIKYDFYQICKKHEYLLIEGVGGITYPLINNKEEKYLLKDFIWELGLNIIIVADMNLDVINSTILTVEYAKTNGIEIEGIILNNYESSNANHWECLEQVESLAGVNVLATISVNANDIMLLEGLFKE